MIANRFTSNLRRLITNSTNVAFIPRFAGSTATTHSPRNIADDIICSQPNVKFDYTKAVINGELKSTEESIDNIDPRTGESFCKFNICNENETHKAILSAREAYDNGAWSRMTGYEKSKLMLKLAELIDTNRDYIASLETYDTGKPIAESHFDIDLSIELLTYYAGYANNIPFDSSNFGGSYQTNTYNTSLLEPIGVIGCIIPWNYPIMELFFKVGTALACGNTCVVKPPETAPLSSLFAGYLALEAGFPKGVLNIVPGYGHITGQSIVESNLIDKISFTGSGVTGKRIMKSMDPRKKLTLELGGKSAVIICDDFPQTSYTVEDIAKLFIEACFANAGQVCTAPTRLFVHERIYDEFVEIAANCANARVVGDPFDSNINQGPVQNENQYKKILGILEKSQNSENRPRVCAGGNKIGTKGYFIEPTVLADVRDDMIVAKQEIFGPTMQILKFSSVDDALKRANNETEYGLAAGFFSNSVDKCNRAARELQAGTVFINLYDVWDACIPFGGYKQSGFGREKGYDAIKWFTKRKNIFQQIKRNSFK